MRYIIIIMLVFGFVSTTNAKPKSKLKKQEFTFFRDLPFKFENDYSGKTDSILKVLYTGGYALGTNEYIPGSRVFSFLDWYLEYNKPFKYDIYSFNLTTDKDKKLIIIDLTILDEKENNRFKKALVENSKKIKNESLNEYEYIIDGYSISSGIPGVYFIYPGNDE